jgi:hypothetical protein
MREYVDYPEHYSEAVIETLQKEYSRPKPTLLQHILKGANMKTLQNEENIANPPTTTPTPAQPSTVTSAENFRLYSLISSNYCNISNLMENIISKTSSGKREIYQRINAQFMVDMRTFNNTFNTVCNMERYNFCNYNQLVYLTIENFIDLTQNLSDLTLLLINDPNYNTALTLRNNAFALFREFIDARPIRY